MPLPSDGSFPLTGYSKPGEAATSKPKQAMIVRLSPETLDALQALQESSDAQPMTFTFGDNPCITVNGESFPLNTGATDKWHDIYLRSSSAGRRNPPFKLYANVIGRYAVQRELDIVGERVREKKHEAENERASRTTIMLDTPPTNVAAPKPKKKKEPPTMTSTMFRKPIPASSVPRAEPAAAAPSLPAEKLKDIRKRLIHCLASGDRTEEAAVKAVSNNPAQRLRQAILQVLDDVAVLVSKSGKTYRLKPQSWKEIRPYEMAIWSEAEKKRIAAEGRAKLKELRVPQGDPVWDHLSPPRPEPASRTLTPSTSTSGSHISSSLKRPFLDKDTDEPLAKRQTVNDRRDRDRESDRERERQSLPSKPVVKSEASRDRHNASSLKTPERSGRERDRDRDTDKDTGRERERGRARPGDKDRRREKEREQDREADRAREGKKDRDRVRDDDRERNRGMERPRDRESAKSGLPSSSAHARKLSVVKSEYAVTGPPRRPNDSPLLPPPPRDAASRPGQRPKARGDESNVESDFERRPKQRTERDPIQRLSRKDKEDGEYSDSSTSSSRIKRKSDDRRGSPDIRDSKKPRTGPGSSNLKPKQEESDTELLRPQRMRDTGHPSSSKANKREQSPLVLPPRDSNCNRVASPPPKRPSALPEKPQIPQRESSFVSNGSSSKPGRQSSKQPRRQPIYTSSEEDGDEPPLAASTKGRVQPTAPPLPKSLPPRPLSPLPSKPAAGEGSGKALETNGRPNGIPSTNGMPQARPTRPLPRKSPSKHDALKKEYNNKYPAYLGGLVTLTHERAKLEAMVAKLDDRGSASLSDSEGDILPPEQLAKLVADHQTRHGELQSIYKTVEDSRLRMSTSGGSSD